MRTEGVDLFWGSVHKPLKERKAAGVNCKKLRLLPGVNAALVSSGELFQKTLKGQHRLAAKREGSKGGNSGPFRRYGGGRDCNYKNGPAEGHI